MIDMMDDLDKRQLANQDFFDDNLDAWLQDDACKGKVVLISNRQLQAVYDQPRDAYHYAMANFQPGEFIVQQVIPKQATVRHIKPDLTARGRHN